MRRSTRLAAVLALLTAAPAEAARVDPHVTRTAGDIAAYVTAAPGAPLDDVRALARRHGLVPTASLRAARAFRAHGEAARFRALARDGRVARLDRAWPARLLTDSSHRATGGRRLLDGTAGIRLDGSGVGIAIVDSGVDTTHPDLAPRIASEHKLVPFNGSGVAVPMTDTLSGGGHGTHVAGIAAGTGAASGGRFHGAAPGASLHVVSMGAGNSTLNGTDAWQYILDNHERLTPRIRVLNNSWGEQLGQLDPEHPKVLLLKALVAKGIVVVNAAGNAGGDGRSANTSAFCPPVAGILCVANYDDRDAGALDGDVAEDSSRGLDGDQATYPDLMAPGRRIMSTCRPWLPVCWVHTAPSLDHPLEYFQLSGTSMAAPHVAGIAAQLLQARPDATPAQIEDALVQTARRLPAGTAPYEPDAARGGMTSFDKGHGLVDAVAALDRLTR
jgi:serine protease AprX